MTAPTPPRIRDVVIPADHGGWGLTLEPVALGLAVAPSIAGAALGVAALMAFLFRTPFKLTAGDYRRHRHLPRTRLAIRGTIVYGVVLAAAVAVAIATTDHRFWPPLAAALPLILIQVGYDARNRSRRLLPEIAGPVAIGSVAAAIALAGGATTTVALGLWLISGLRSIASILLVRAQLRRARQHPYRPWMVHTADVAVATIAVATAAAGVIPWLGAAAIAMLTPFGIWSLHRPAVRAVVVGIQQTVLGAVIVIITVVGVRAGI